MVYTHIWDKAPACHAGDLGSIPGLGRSPGERNGNPRQYSCLGNPIDRGSWRATVHGVRVRHDLVTEHILAVALSCMAIITLMFPVHTFGGFYHR